MGEYDGSAAMALRLIQKKGRTVTLRTKSGTYNPDTDDFSSQTEDDASVKAVFTNYSNSQIDGELVRRGDKRLLMAALGLESSPSGRDQVIDGDDTYKIISFETIQPGDTPILYKVQVRK